MSMLLGGNRAGYWVRFDGTEIHSGQFELVCDIMGRLIHLGHKVCAICLTEIFYCYCIAKTVSKNRGKSVLVANLSNIQMSQIIELVSQLTTSSV